MALVAYEGGGMAFMTREEAELCCSNTIAADEEESPAVSGPSPSGEEEEGARPAGPGGLTRLAG